MAWNEPNIKRYESSAFFKVPEYTDAEDAWGQIRSAIDDGTHYDFSTEDNFFKYSDEKVYKVTIIIEQA